MNTAIIVGNDVDLVESFSEFLELRDVKVIGTARNGFEGVKLFEEKMPDMVFSDLHMHNSDGTYILENIKKPYPDSNVILMTSRLTQKMITKLTDLHPDGIIFKPFRINQVINILEEISQKKISLAI